MASSDQLRKNINQHRAKNTESKSDDKKIYGAMLDCIAYLKGRFPNDLQGYELIHKKSISYEKIIKTIKNCGLRYEFDTEFFKRTIKPDGGAIWLEDKTDKEKSRLVLVSEVKRQGTNKQRQKEGKPPQSQGNAIERLGKNLTGIRAMMNHEQITPFVCFGSGCDFKEDYGDDFVMSKISMMNEFYKLNKLHVYKRDGSSNKNCYSPVSMFFREEEWTREEMFEILKEIGEDAIRYYLH